MFNQGFWPCPRQTEISLPGEFGFLILLAILTLVLTNIGNNLVVVFTMLSVVSMMLNQGIVFNAPVAVTMITVLGLAGLLLPASSVYGAMIHSCEMTTSASSIKYAFIAMLLMIATSMFILIPLGSILF